MYVCVWEGMSRRREREGSREGEREESPRGALRTGLGNVNPFRTSADTRHLCQWWSKGESGWGRWGGKEGRVCVELRYMEGRCRREMLCAAFGKDVVNRPGGLEGSVEGTQHARPHVMLCRVWVGMCVENRSGGQAHTAANHKTRVRIRKRGEKDAM